MACVAVEITDIRSPFLPVFLVLPICRAVRAVRPVKADATGIPAQDSGGTVPIVPDSRPLGRVWACGRRGTLAPEGNPAGPGRAGACHAKGYTGVDRGSGGRSWRG